MIQRKLSEATEDYLAYLRGTSSESTCKAARTALTSIRKQAGDVYVRNLTSAHVDAWMEAVVARGVRPATQRSYLSQLKSFCRWARARKLAPAAWEPVGRRSSQRSVPRAQLYVPVDRFPELLDAAHCDRDRGLMAFGLFTLARISEMRRVTIGDLDMADSWVQLEVQKSGKRDRLPMSLELREEMERWLESYRTTMGGPLHADWFLFPPRVQDGLKIRDENGRLFSRFGEEIPYRVDRPAHPNTIAHAVQAALTNMGLNTALSGGHTLRRSGARARFDHLRSLGYDGALRDVQTLLHHESSKTTEIYLGLTVEIQRRNEDIRNRHMYGQPQGSLINKEETRRLRLVQ